MWYQHIYAKKQKNVVSLIGKKLKPFIGKGKRLSGNHKIFKHSSVEPTNACLSKMTLFVMPCSPPKESASITQEGYPTHKRLY